MSDTRNEVTGASGSEVQSDDPIALCIRGRRTLSRFSSKQVDQRLLFDAIEIARWAPNHHLTEPWHFYILGRVSTDKTIDLIYSLAAERKTEELAQRKKRRAEKIPSWVVVTSRRSDNEVTDREDYAATSCAIQNFSLSLWRHGVGLKWCTGALVDEPRFFDILNLDQGDEHIVGVLRIGYPVNQPVQKRNSVAQITTVLK